MFWLHVNTMWGWLLTTPSTLAYQKARVWPRSHIPMTQKNVRG